MKKLIIKPLNIFGPSDIMPLLERLKQTPKLYLLTGKESVGKTAFCIKVLYGLLKDPENSYPVRYMSNETSNYWKNILLSANRLPETVIKEAFEKNNERPFMEDNTLTIWDDFFKYYSIGKDITTFTISLLLKLAQYRKANFILTGSVAEPLLSNPFIKRLQEQYPIELWHLERPKWLGGEIKEFGDTRLWVY